MRIVHEYPPNYAAIIKAFPWVEKTKGVLFCYGLNIFNPDSIAVSPSIMDHEEVHSLQQDDDPAGWWDKYLASPEFRFGEEVKAHICEYVNIYRNHDRNKRRLYLNAIAERLSGPLYGGLATKATAIRLLKTGADVLLKPQTQREPEPHGKAQTLEGSR